MIAKIEMNIDINGDDFDEIKKIEHHADYLLNLDDYPEIKSVFNVKVTAINKQYIHVEYLLREKTSIIK